MTKEEFKIETDVSPHLTRQRGEVSCTYFNWKGELHTGR